MGRKFRIQLAVLAAGMTAFGWRQEAVAATTSLIDGNVYSIGAAAPQGGSASPANIPPGIFDPGAGSVALEADFVTGKLYLVGHDSNIASYEVDSAAGKLTFVSKNSPGGYNTLEAQSANQIVPGSDNPNEDVWTVRSFVAGKSVAEFYPSSDHPPYDTIGPALQVFDMNVSGLSAWTAGTPLSDLTFKYADGTPEPTCLALAGIAAGGLLSRRRRRNS